MAVSNKVPLGEQSTVQHEQPLGFIDESIVLDMVLNEVFHVV